MTPEVKQDTVDGVKLMIIGSMLADYGCRLIVDDTKQHLKYRVKCVMNAVKNVEMHFINHNNTTPEYREAFKRAFNKNETVLLADLNLICWQINEEGIEEIINAVKQAITQDS
jgi:hypothetical protein